MGSKKKQQDNMDKHSDEYREKRMKNNVAVKRSRDKSKAKARESQTRVQQLQMENEQLQNTVDAMTSELRYLKEMLISQAGTGAEGTTEYLSADTVADLEDILQDETPTDLAKLTTVLNEMKRIHTVQIQRSAAAAQHDPQVGGVGGGYAYQQQQGGGQMYPGYDPNSLGVGSHYPL